MTTLTNHKKAVRALAPSQKEFSFVSAGADNVKKWQVCVHALLSSSTALALFVYLGIRSARLGRLYSIKWSEII